jgi:hypothetical protein
MNRPPSVGEMITRNGARKRIIVSARGHLYSVTICEG